MCQTRDGHREPGKWCWLATAIRGAGLWEDSGLEMPPFSPGGPPARSLKQRYVAAGRGGWLCSAYPLLPGSPIEGSKLAALETLLEELRDNGHRALVFSQFVDHLQLVRTRLDTLGVRYQYLDGSSSIASRAASTAAFQAGEGDVFLISLKAGGFGLNLTAADYVVHLDPWWNPAVEDQASDRAHRIGQTRPVTIYRLVMQGSIEEKIPALHTTKRELADGLLEGTSGARAFDVDELLGLLSEANNTPSASVEPSVRA
jgi:SNF2 family DNA or RNA helicase